MPDEDLQFR